MPELHGGVADGLHVHRLPDWPGVWVTVADGLARPLLEVRTSDLEGIQLARWSWYVPTRSGTWATLAHAARH